MVSSNIINNFPDNHFFLFRAQTGNPQQSTRNTEMKITDHIKNAKGKTLFSFELLPPIKGQSIQWIYDAIDPLLEFNPPFIDVTSLREDYIYKEQENGLLQKVPIVNARVRLPSVLQLFINIKLMPFRI